MNRAERRNVARDEGTLTSWHTAGYAARALERSKWVDRALQVRLAVKVFAKALTRKDATRGDAFAKLADYWRTQPRTRVVSRILNELGHVK